MIKILFLINLVNSLLQPTFEEFCLMYNKTYYKNLQRKLIYESNVNLINNHNLDLSFKYKLNVNQWADLTWEEFQSQQLSLTKIVNSQLANDKKVNTISPVDWRMLGKVGSIKDQGICGSCWAFSALASLENILSISKNISMSDLSEQQLIDCSTENYGCNGGLMNNAYKYIAKNGIASENLYPYMFQKQTCKNINRTDKTFIRGYAIVNSAEYSVLKAVSKQVVTAGIEVDPLFRFYKSGIYNKGNCKNKLNHAINIVGYTNDYWIVRNSWGTDWGEQGYIRMARNKNICGINLMVSYPVL